MDERLGPARFQGIDRQSNAYRLLSTMGWKEGEGLVRAARSCLQSCSIQLLRAVDVRLSLAATAAAASFVAFTLCPCYFLWGLMAVATAHASSALLS